MRRLVTILTVVALAIWSLFAWAVYGLLGYAGDLAAANADLLLIPPEWAYWGAALLGGAGGAVIWIVWGLGALLIVLCGLIGSRLLGSGDRDARETYRGGSAPFGGAPLDRGTADRGAFDHTSYDQRPLDPRPLDQRPLDRGVTDQRSPGAGGSSAQDVIARVLGKPPRR